MKLKCFLLTTVIVACCPTLSYSFKAKGHWVIENAAYCQLKNEPPVGDLPSGQVIYDSLLKRNILLNVGNYNSSYPDLDLGRQFLSDRQVYHFMADKRNVKMALKENSRDKKQLSLVKNSLPGCLNMLYIMCREVVDNSIGAHQAGRGTYVLIHAITDSYSKDHVIRNTKNGEVECIKSWQ